MRSDATLEDIGFIQQAALFEQVHGMTREIPIVIDSREFLLDPDSMLRLFCDRLGVGFDPKMLHWPSGARDSDGVWARHWV